MEYITGTDFKHFHWLAEFLATEKVNRISFYHRFISQANHYSELANTV